MTEPQQSPQIHCPKCDSTQLFADKKGFSGKKAVAGAMLTGGIGILAGTIGSNKVKITCLNCGHVFRPGETYSLEKKKAAIDLQKKELAKSRAEMKIRKDFFSAYEAGNKEEAFEMLKQKDPFSSKYSNADEAYSKLKIAVRLANIGCIIVVVIILSIIIFMAYFKSK